MFIGLISAASAVSIVVLIVVLFVQRGREGVDLSAGSLLRAYLYAGSFAGLVALVFGLAAVGNFVLASAVGNDLVYGAAPNIRPVEVPCPPNAPNCVQKPTPEDQARIRAEQNERRRNEDLVRGITFTVFGAVFYGAHYAARRGVMHADEPQGGLRRAYLMVGTAVFGLATVVLVPTGVYQLLADAILPAAPETFRPGVADSLTAGLVSLVVWLVFLRLVVADFRRGSGA